jgi:acetyl-CoA/propionyl-CoA carboxylase biotin carboxyl carrier protein
MREASIRLAAAVGYRSTGTVEFLYEPAARRFYFLEMNTRLQVEHGVTELVTGIDLVAARLSVAAGHPLAIAQDDVRIRGHAIEVRLAAEDPWQRFLPCPGTIDELHVPAGPWVRADFGVAAGDRVPGEYDSLFGKLMAWGPDRESARRRLITALGELRLSGPATTAPFLRDVLQRTAFVRGTYSTTSLEAHWLPGPASRPQVRADTASPVGDCPDATGNNMARDEQVAVRLLEVHAAQGPFRVAVHSRQHRGLASEAVARTQCSRAAPGPPGSFGQPSSPMDGVVVKVGVQTGDKVEQHAVVAVIEAMKMQIPVTAPRSGEVDRILVKTGDSVTAGQQLAEIAQIAEADH